mmetsp:Transcript_14027/g.21237  ORF Transcript_14027/g.21237 Transcript_14027/m.21237 type:complete len:331 (+) Transcript_14027:121-1113(+)
MRYYENLTLDKLRLQFRETINTIKRDTDTVREYMEKAKYYLKEAENMKKEYKRTRFLYYMISTQLWMDIKKTSQYKIYTIKQKDLIENLLKKSIKEAERLKEVVRVDDVRTNTDSYHIQESMRIEEEKKQFKRKMEQQQQQQQQMGIGGIGQESAQYLTRNPMSTTVPKSNYASHKHHSWDRNEYRNQTTCYNNQPQYNEMQRSSYNQQQQQQRYRHSNEQLQYNQTRLQSYQQTTPTYMTLRHYTNNYQSLMNDIRQFHKSENQPVYNPHMNPLSSQYNYEPSAPPQYTDSNLSMDMNILHKHQEQEQQNRLSMSITSKQFGDLHYNNN